MKLDSYFVKEFKQSANGDGSKEARIDFLRRASAAARDLGNPSVMREFGKILQKHGRIPVTICIAATASQNKEHISRKLADWSDEILKLYTNKPHDLSRFAYNDGLHPSRIDEYTAFFVDNTIKEEY